MPPSLAPGQTTSDQLPELCSACNLCCSGDLFDQVTLGPGDNRAALAAARLKPKGKPGCFAQPCPALQGESCTIYPLRPKRCREFECKLFGRVRQGNLDLSAALGLVREVRGQLEGLKAILARHPMDRAGKPLFRRYLNVLSAWQSQASLGELENPPGEPLSLPVLERRMNQLQRLFHEHFYVVAPQRPLPSASTLSSGLAGTNPEEDIQPFLPANIRTERDSVAATTVSGDLRASR